MNTLYKNIIILNETDTKLIGDFQIDGLMEADSTSNDKSSEKSEEYNNTVFGGLSGVLKYFNNDTETVKKVRASLDKGKEKLKGGKLKDIFLFLIQKLTTILAGPSRALMKAIDYLWSGSTSENSKWKGFRSLPGLSQLTGFVNKLLQKTGISQMKLFNTELKLSDLAKFLTITFVLVGSIGFIVKKIKDKIQANNESIDYDIDSMPLVLTEGDSMGDSFIKKGSGALAKLVNFMKNVGDKASSLLLGVVATIIASGLLLLAMLATRKPVLAAIKFAVEYRNKDAADPKREKSAIDKTKYVGALLVESAAKVATFGPTKSDIYLQDSGINEDASNKAKKFVLETDAAKIKANENEERANRDESRREADLAFKEKNKDRINDLRN